MQKPFELFSGLNKTLTGMKGRSDEEGGGGGGDGRSEFWVTTTTRK